MSENKLHLKITTHEKVVFESDVDEIYSKSVQGEFGVLPNHIAFTCSLDIGLTKVVIGPETQYFAIMGGVFQLKENQVLILAQTAENGRDIDAARAKASKERAEARLAESSDDVSIKRAEVALARALVRLKASTNK